MRQYGINMRNSRTHIIGLSQIKKCKLNIIIEKNN